jgi:malate synthase
MSVIDRPVQFNEDAASPAPGVEMVLTTSDSSHLELLDSRTLRLIGALHRRFWDRRRDLLLRRAQSGLGMDADSPNSLTTWEDRVARHLELASEDLSANNADLRGWGETEPAVLVDGRAVPGCVFDLAVVLSSRVDQLRLEESTITVTAPTPLCADEERLYEDLTKLAQDRAGIDRGTLHIRYV